MVVVLKCQTNTKTMETKTKVFKDWTDGALLSAKMFGEDIGDISLLNCLKRLEDYQADLTVLVKDYAPFSFEFAHYYEDANNGTHEIDGTMYRMFINGGLIFHGQHDGGGCGSAPTFSVNLTPSTGWSIHT